MVTIPVVRNFLESNEEKAKELMDMFKKEGVVVLNLMSSPGAGKTSLLEKTISKLKEKWKIGVIEGDIQTTKDAERLNQHGIPTVQINTGGACHLDSGMIMSAVPEINLSLLDILFIENVGNLVCPAEFKVGEDHKVMILSVTEGEDKPSKYPLMFRESSVLIINKIDLLPYLDIDLDTIREEALKINPDLQIFPISCKTEEGLEDWYNWLQKEIVAKKR